MNKSVQVLRLAFLLGSFFNNLGWVENSAVGKRAQSEVGAEHSSHSMRRRMMLGIGSEVSTSSIWGYLDPASENERALLKRHEHEHKRANPLSTIQPAIVLEDGGLSQKASSPQGTSDSSALDSNSKRSRVAGPPQHGTTSQVKTEIVLLKRKLSEVAGRAYSNGNSKIVLSNNGKRSTQRGDSAGLNSKIVLSNGKRSASPQQGSSSGGNRKIALSKTKRAVSHQSGNSGEVDSKIVLSNGKRSAVGSSTSAQSDSKIVLSNGKRAEAGSSSAIESDIVLGNPGKRSERTASSPRSHSESGILSKKIKRSEIATKTRRGIEVATPISNSVPGTTGKKMKKRYEMDLMAANFAKPLPIFEQFDE